MGDAPSSLDGSPYAFAIVVSRFNPAVTEKLLKGARDGLAAHGVSPGRIQIVRVPGAFEIPTAARAVALTGKVHAVICLGAVVRGQTAHYESVVRESARGIAQIGLDTGVPAIHGVLAADSEELLLERAGGEMGNKGWQAALAAIEMAGVMAPLGSRKKE